MGTLHPRDSATASRDSIVAVRPLHPSMRNVFNTEPLALSALAPVEMGTFREAVVSGVEQGGLLSAFFGYPDTSEGLALVAALCSPLDGTISVIATRVEERYPSLTPDCPQAHMFEREIAEQWGVIPEGHPWFKPVRNHPSYVAGRDAWNRNETGRMDPSLAHPFVVEGTQVHEVAVGPVHAGVIEPGHFRFQCDGERVFHLEIALGYQHRGIEKALRAGPGSRTIHLMETLAGDTTIGHALAYSQAIEGFTGKQAPPRAEALRGIALELERLANHTGDLGALAGDVGYLPTASFCGRIRGDFLNMTAMLCGNRFGRGLVRPGGVGFDLSPKLCDELRKKLDAAFRDVTVAVELLWNAPSVMSRFENTGLVTAETCEALGLVGVAARACGVERDVRQDYPFGIYCFSQIPVSTWYTGDVLGRAQVRWLEIKRSITFIQEQLSTLASGEVRDPLPSLPPGHLIVSLVEGWRGQICHVTVTDEHGKQPWYKVVDPSFHNWTGLAVALRGEKISDFPLCNKSFNLSYCGHDL